MQTISIDINKVQKGDETEFRLLFNLFYPRLMSVACRFVPEHIAEDIVQSVFVMYWEQKSALIPNAIHSFLYKCTQNNCLNYLKHQAVVLGHEEEVRTCTESHKILERGFEGGIVLSVVFASLIPSCRLFLESVKNKMQKKHFFSF